MSDKNIIMFLLLTAITGAICVCALWLFIGRAVMGGL